MVKLNSLRATTLTALLITCCSFAAAQPRPKPDDDPRHDIQIWPDTQITLKLRPNFNLTFFGTVRAGRDSSAFVSEQAGIGVSRSFGRHFSSSFFYRYVNSEPTPDRQSREHRLFVDLTPRRALGWGLSLSDRNRIEWRDVNARISWRYRNRLQFERPLAVGEKKVTPYVAGEVMYDTRFHAWNRSQVLIGTRVPLSKHVTFDGFYMRQFDARVQPGFLHVIGAFWRLEY